MSRLASIIRVTDHRLPKRHEPTKAANRAASHCTCAWCFDFRSTPYDCRWPSLDVRRARARTSTMPPVSNAAAPRYGEDDVEPGRSPTICCAEQLYPGRVDVVPHILERNGDGFASREGNVYECRHVHILPHLHKDHPLPSTPRAHQGGHPRRKPLHMCMVF